MKRKFSFNNNPKHKNIFEDLEEILDTSPNKIQAT